MKLECLGKPEGCKLIRVSAELEDGVITTISIRGDFFAFPEEGFERAQSRLAPCPLEDLASRLDALLAEEGVEPYGIHGNAVAEVLYSALKQDTHKEK